LTDELVKRVQSGQPIRNGDLSGLDPEGLLSFKLGEQLVLEDEEGLRGVAVVRAKCPSNTLADRDSGAIVLDVERVLR
jgi:hypothetical protein